MAEHPGRMTRGRVTTRGGQRMVAQGEGQDETVVKGLQGSSAGETSLVIDLFGNDSGGTDRGVNAEPHLAEPAEDEVDLYTWCDQCCMNTIGDCFIHGKVITVTDNKLPSRARLSLPSILALKKIKDNDENEKEGVFAKRLIKPRTQFGPLEAPVLQEGKRLPPDIFDVRVVKPGVQHQLDLSQEEACNWMMFVRPAQFSQESNLAAYQMQDHIYYISTKTIHQMTELRVWYLQSYGQQFNKRPLPVSLPQVQILQESSDDANALITPEEDSMMAVVGTRTSAALSQSKLTCGMCSAHFRSLPQLVAHNCHGIDEVQVTEGSPRPARRKGRPRKVPGTGKRGKPVTRSSSNAVAANASGETREVEAVSTPLPSVTTLIKTESVTEVAVPDSTVPNPHQQEVRKRGRPKGSKNKSPAAGEVKKITTPKPLTSMKRKRLRLDCRHCDRSFYSEEQHRIHEAEHTGTKPYVCPHAGCGKGFGSKFKYIRHVLIHEQPQDRKCPYCDRSFNRIDHLKNHVATHSSNRQHWSCEKCGKQYLYRCTYDYHMAVHQAQEGTDLKCSICALQFSSRESLVKHVQSHNRYKPDPERSKNHQCPTCPKSFTTSKDVRRHMVTHTKDRSFLCEFCPQTFARKDHLRRHYKSNHKGEVLEKAAASNSADSHCHVCLKTFKSEKLLQCHWNSAHKDLMAEETDNAAAKGEKVGKRHGIMQVPNPQKPKVVVMQGTKITLPESIPVNLHPQQVQQQVLQQQQQLSLLPQPTAQAVHLQPHPVQIFTNPQQQQQPLDHHQPQQQPQQQQQQQHQNILQAAPYIANHPAVSSGGQAMEVVELSDQYSQQLLTLKTIPCRFPSGQILASLQPSQPTSQPATATSVRQILHYQPHPQQQQQQHQQQQPQHQQQAQQHQLPQPQTFSQSDIQATSTIVSMLASASRAEGFLDLAGGKGQAVYVQDAGNQLKTLPAQWVLAGNSNPALPDSGQMNAVGSNPALPDGSNPALPDSSSVQAGAEIRDHCYATGVTTAAGGSVADGGGGNSGVDGSCGSVKIELSSLAAVAGKVTNSVTPISDMETFSLLQSCQVGGLEAVGGQCVTTQSAVASHSSGLQASWDTLSDLVTTIPLADIMPLSASQASIIHLPVPDNVPSTDGPVNVTASVTLTQPS